MEKHSKVFAWGSDSQGQLGFGAKSTKVSQKVPKLVNFQILIKELSCGEEHSALITQSGLVYTLGSNSDGRLGIGTKSITHSSSPCLVEFLTSHKSIKISSGWAHTVVITDTGKAFAWGLGEYGALGTGSTETLWTPTAVCLPSAAVEVSCGSRHTGFVLSSHLKYNLFMCGASESGQLGTGGREKETSPVSVLTEEPVKQVACGIFQTGIVTVTGQVYMTGGNSFGQLGLGNRKGKTCFTKVEALNGVSVAKVCCSNFSAVLTEKGGVYVWGSGSFGECLVPYKVHGCVEFREISVGTGFGVLIDGDGSLYSFGGNSEGELGCEEESRSIPQVVRSVKGRIGKVACGSKFVLALGCEFVEGKEEKGRGGDVVNKEFAGAKMVKNKSLRVVKGERRNVLIEKLEKSVERIRVDLRKSQDKGVVEEENKEIYRKMERLMVKNMDLQQQVFGYKEKLGKVQKVEESEKKSGKFDEHSGQKNAKDLINAEIFKNSLILAENERLKQENQKLIHAVKRYKVVNDEIHEENLRVLQKVESERQKLKTELETSNKELKNISQVASETDKKEVEELKTQIIEQKKVLESLQSEINILKAELTTKSNAFQREKLQMKQDFDTLSQKFSDLSKDYSNLLKTSEKTLVDYEKLLNSDKTLTQSLQNAQVLSERLQIENETLSNQLRSTLETHKTQNNLLHINQEALIQSLSEKLSKKTQESSEVQLELNTKTKESSDLLLELRIKTKENSDLLFELRTKSEENSNLVLELNTKIKENSNIQLELSSKIKENSDILLELNTKNEENSNIQFELSTKIKENSDLLLELNQRNKEIQELETNFSKYVQENNLLKQKIEELRQELDENKENKGSLTVKFEKVIKENKELKVQITEMEGKSREIFGNLEKDLANKAKVYKERTMNLLGGPRSSVNLGSSFCLENKELSKTGLDDAGRNPAASLLTALDKSPGRSTTPTKESVKKRISELLRDKTQIEEQLSKCEY